ncbi:MAG: ABC transporter permease [Vicinamibacterales bacterium]
MNGVLLDVRLALRRLTRRPGTAVVFVAMLALGLTAAATATGVVQALLLRPLPFTTLDRLVLVREDLPVTGVEQRAPVTPADVVALRSRGEAFEQIAAFRFRPRMLGSGAGAEQIHVAEASASFWPALDVRAAAGRTFGPDEEMPGRDGVAVLNETFWRERLGGASILGRSMLIDGRAFIVIGVVAARYPLAVDVWVPLALSPVEWEDRTARRLQVVALLKRRVTTQAAEADARRVAAAIAGEYPDTHRGRSLRLLALRAEQYEFTLGLFSVVQIVALGVLIVAAANAVTIMTVKVLDGRPEAATRAALGASVFRVVRPYVLEAATLSATAGVLAILMAQWTVPLVRRGVPPGIAKWIAGWDTVRLDVPLALATWCAATAIGIVVGIWSGARGARGNLAAMIAWEGRVGTGAPGRGRELVLALQAGVSVVLLSVAVLFSAGLSDIRATFREYDPDHVLLARVTAPAHRYPEATDVVAFFERAAAAAAALPGVRVAGLVQNAPASNVPNPVRGIWPAEEPPAKGTPSTIADVQIADARGLSALGLRVTSGREFRSGDAAAAPRVALVSRQLASRLWGARDPLGRLVALDDGSRWQVIGLVEDILLNWYDGGPRPTLYLPHAQTSARGMTLVLRAGGSPESLVGPLGVAVRRIERDPPPLRTFTLRSEVDDALAPLLTLAWLLAALSLVAFALATAGIYGVAASAVVLRTREMGIRVVLGARPRALARLVLRVVARPVALGCAVGIPAAAALVRWLSAHTFGLLELDPAVPIAVGALLLAAAALGAWTPSRRAARVDPIVTLRG